MTKSSGASTYYIPLDFWFCRNPGLALPMIALQYHEVKVRVELEELSKLRRNDSTDTGTVAGAISSINLLCDYIYLDTDERRRFAQVSHEYLIEQVQHNGPDELTSGTDQTQLIKMSFNHPVKELVWVLNGTCKGITNVANYISKAKIQLSGNDRLKEETGDYFTSVQPFQHHTGIGGHSNTIMPGQTHGRANTYGYLSSKDNGYYCYSFALNPEEHQPSGTCNFSRVDNAVLNLTTTLGATTEMHLFAHGYNVLRIMSGMGAMAYSN